MNRERTALILALTAVLFWSTVATAFKLALEVLTPRWMLTFAVISSFLVLTLVLLRRGQLVLAWRSIGDQWLAYGRQALINPVAYYLILFQAYHLLPAQQAQAINYTWAITMSLLAVPLLGHKLFARDLIALTLAYVGVLVIATRGNVLALEFDSLTGVLLALASTLLWAFYWILNTRAARQGQQLEPAISLWAGFLFAIPILLVIALVWDGAPFALSAVEGLPAGEVIEPNLFHGLLASVYIGVFEMGITFLLWQSAMNLTQRTAAISSLIFLSPFVSLIFINRILGEDIHAATLVGLVLIIAGLAVQKLAGKRNAETSTPSRDTAAESRHPDSNP